MNPIDTHSADWNHGPFGEANASRSDTAEQYISVPGVTLDLDANRIFERRIIIGKKGAGKTFYLRALVRSISESSSSEWIVFNEDNKLSAEFVSDLTRQARASYASLALKGVYVDSRARSRDFWTQCWERALFVACFQIITNHKGYRRSASKDELELEVSLKDFVDGFYSIPTNSPIGAIEAFAHYSDHHYTKLSRFLSRPEWGAMASFLASTSRHVPLIAIVIDCLDDNFDAAPDAWLECQHGLFKSIFELLTRMDGFANRIHIMVSLREVVFSSILNTEHATRHLLDPKVAYITWNEAASAEFFRQKLNLLLDKKKSLFEQGNASSHLSNLCEQWLGFPSVSNGHTGKTESVADYILRHTRLLPRDIVVMGNAIEAALSQRQQENREMSERKLRQVVANVAQSLARESIFSCANEFIASLDYMSDALSSEDVDELMDAEQSEVNRTILQIKSSIADEIIAVMEKIGNRFFDREILVKALEKSPLNRFDDEENSFFAIENILFRHGLVSYQVLEGENYKWISTWQQVPYSDRSRLPKDALLYRFHSSLADLVPALYGHEG